MDNPMLNRPWRVGLTDEYGTQVLNAEAFMIGKVAAVGDATRLPHRLMAEALCAAVNAGEASLPLDDVLRGIAEHGAA